MITILWGCIIAMVVALLLVCIANRIGFKTYLSEQPWHTDSPPPLVQTPPVSPGRQVEVLSKLNIGKPDFKKG